MDGELVTGRVEREREEAREDDVAGVATIQQELRRACFTKASC